MSHTPGPWCLCMGGQCSCRMVWGGDGECCVAVAHSEHWFHSIGDPYPQKEEADANARLITAAPDLLAALKALLKSVEGVPCGPEVQCLAAIAKAEGEADHGCDPSGAKTPTV